VVQAFLASEKSLRTGLEKRPHPPALQLKSDVNFKGLFYKYGGISGCLKQLQRGPKVTSLVARGSCSHHLRRIGGCDAHRYLRRSAPSPTSLWFSPQVSHDISTSSAEVKTECGLIHMNLLEFPVHLPYTWAANCMGRCGRYRMKWTAIYAWCKHVMRLKLAQSILWYVYRLHCPLLERDNYLHVLFTGWLLMTAKIKPAPLWEWHSR
jgi:hypothetical protein